MIALKELKDYIAQEQKRGLDNVAQYDNLKRYNDDYYHGYYNGYLTALYNIKALIANGEIRE